MKRSYLKVDPNYATTQQLAAMLLINGDATNIVDKLETINTDAAGNQLLTAAEIAFSEGLRQFDTAFSGAIFGENFQFVGYDLKYNIYGARFPADPMLQNHATGGGYCLRSRS